MQPIPLPSLPWQGSWPTSSHRSSSCVCWNNRLVLSCRKLSTSLSSGRPGSCSLQVSTAVAEIVHDLMES